MIVLRLNARMFCFILNPSKCRFFKEVVTYLGFKCNAKGIETDPDRMEKVLNFPVPKNIKQVQSWLGLVNYYKKFVKNHSEILEPITELTRKEQRIKPYLWTFPSGVL